MKGKIGGLAISHILRSRTLSTIIFLAFFHVWSNSLSAQPSNLPGCGKANSRGRIVGERLLLTVPNGAKIKKAHDVDYADYSITFSVGEKKYFLSGIYGLNATSGNVPKFLSDEGNYEEKQWVADDPNAGQATVPGVDARGKHKNGNFWRRIGTGGEAVRYSDVPQEAAEFFDTILDSVCYSPWKIDRPEK